MSKPLYSKSTTNCPAIGGASTITMFSENGIKVPVPEPQEAVPVNVGQSEYNIELIIIKINYKFV
jgi:hypothetical protein